MPAGDCSRGHDRRNDEAALTLDPMGSEARAQADGLGKNGTPQKSSTSDVQDHQTLHHVTHSIRAACQSALNAATPSPNFTTSSIAEITRAPHPLPNPL